MNSRWLTSCLLGLSLISSALAVEPSPERQWVSSTGTKIIARAVDLSDQGLVTLETSDGRNIKLKFRQLSKPDQEFLLRFFKRAEEANKNTGPKPGTVKGPIKADDDTSYYVYIPSSYRKEIRSSVMIWTQSDGGRRSTLEPLREAADLTGMVIATPVEARDEEQSTLANNLSHSTDVLRALRMKLSINGSAVYYGGDDTGGAAALFNSMKNKSAGTFTVSAYFTPQMNGSNAGYHFMAGEATDYNRYLTAWSAAKFGDNGTHFLYAGSRDRVDSDTATTGILWMFTQSLYGNLASRSHEAAAFQKRFVPWIEDLAETSPGEALYLTDVLTERCAIRGGFKSFLESVEAELNKQEEAIDHLGGREALSTFSRKFLADYGNLYTPLKNHDPAKFTRMTERMAEEYDKAELLQPVFKKLEQPTVN